MTTSKPSFKALLPFFVFIFTFLGVGIVQEDFYALPAPIAVIAGIIVAFFLFKHPINTKIKTLLEGCGDPKILTMCLIYLLAGAFAAVIGGGHKIKAALCVLIGGGLAMGITFLIGHLIGASV